MKGGRYVNLNDLVTAAGGTSAIVAILAVAIGTAIAVTLVSLAITVRANNG
jgi:hypothetical protein